MTKLKIKEKVQILSTVEEELNSLNDIEAGDMLYSYNWDKLILVAGTPDGGFEIIDLQNGEVVGEEDGDYWHIYFQRYNDEFGPFYLVDKAKLTFKVGS